MIGSILERALPGRYPNSQRVANRSGGRPAKAPNNRSAMARRKRKRLLQGDSIAATIRDARQLATTLHGHSASQLREHTERLRRFKAQHPEDGRLLALAGAGVIEAVRQVLNLDLFDVQLRAGIIVSGGAIAEMQTGEGKTLSVALPAYVQALSGRGVHVATPNSYLAQRDCERLTPVFERLGMTTGLLQEQARPEEAAQAYRADITYGPGQAFGFDYLRDQLTLSGSSQSSVSQRPLGEITLNRIRGCTPESKLLQRGLFASIVDEIDHVLLDDAISPLLLSGSGDEEAADAELHQQARSFSRQLSLGSDYQIHGTSLQLTDAGFESCYADSALATHSQLIRPWHEYVVLALRARCFMTRDVHYVVRQGEIQLIDASTGRIFEDRTWSAGLHQAVQAAEGLTVTCETTPLARITRQRFYRYYENLGGMTGTASGCESEFAAVYGLPVVVVPLRKPTRRRMLSARIMPSHEEKLSEVVEEAKTMQQEGRAVLIGTLNIAESLAIAAKLTEQRLSFELLNGIQDAEEAAIVSRAGSPGAITVATNLAGRGTDIGLHPEVAARGGLHVIVTEMHALQRVDRQLIGRCARCGDPGSARVFFSADDPLVANHAPWLQRAMGRWADADAANLLHHRATRIQAELQRSESAQRWSLLQADQANEQLLHRAKPHTAPAGCWQL